MACTSGLFSVCDFAQKHLSHVSHVYVMSEAFKIWHREIKFELSAFHFVQQNSKQLKLKYQSFISHFEMQERGCRLCEGCVCWKLIWNQTEKLWN